MKTSIDGTVPPIINVSLLRKLRSELKRNHVTLEFGNVATNCGLIRLNDEYIGVFKNGTFSFCWEMGLKDNADPHIGIRQILYIVKFNNKMRLTDAKLLSVEISGLSDFNSNPGLLEDARLIYNGKDVVIVVNYVPGGGKEVRPKQTKAWPLIGILDTLNSKVKLCKLNLSNTEPPQKNWIPFAKEGETFLQYSIIPHRILRVNPGTGQCSDAWLTHADCQFQPIEGGLKGGAPLVEIDDRMIGACHSWFLNENNEREYLTYFYLTQANPPYKILKISSPLKILIPQRVQYLVGMVLNKKKNCLLLSYGVNDCDNYFVEFQLKSLLDNFK